MNCLLGMKCQALLSGKKNRLSSITVMTTALRVKKKTSDYNLQNLNINRKVPAVLNSLMLTIVKDVFKYIL